jgi:hypothetical protein
MRIALAFAAPIVLFVAAFLLVPLAPIILLW